VDPDTTIEEVARVMLSQRVHRVLVSGANGLEGILTTFDLLHAVSRPRDTRAIHHTGHQR
ncbi:MAG TPA: CBS domain-containing protein, partial [Kofleriaceae bacterium]